MILLDDNLMEKEEKELRRLLPISVLLHNCLVLALSKESLIKFPKRKTQPFAQDGVDRDFWKFGNLLVCHDKSELNFDKFLLFNHFPTSKKEERDVMKKELQRWKIFSTIIIFQICIFHQLV